MNDEITPGSGADPQHLSADLLSEALEDLAESRASGREVPPAPAEEACPEPGELALLLGPEARPDAHPSEFTKVSALLAHASGCRVCAQRLRVLTADETPEETALLAGLGSMSTAGQRKMAVELARTPHGGGKRASRLYLWTGAGMAASVLIAAGLVSWWRMSNDPERLLAAAYTDSRIFDLRMPQAGFAEVTPGKHLRGGSTGRESAKLLEARARIERHLEAAPEDAHWLQLEARSDVLEEKFDSAIDILDRLVAAGPVTASLLLDDASAYFQRGVATGSENDRATALDYLRRADELAPSDPVVLFNEAVAMEDRGQVMNAVETWNRYLRFERDARWQAEGQRRLQALKQKLNQLQTHQSRMQQYLATPQSMRTLAADAAALSAVDEELSTTLLPLILNQAFPVTPDQSTAARSRGSPVADCREDCQSARMVLYALAASLERNHNDPWLTQLLPSSSLPGNSSSTTLYAPRFIAAIHALSQAIDAEVHGDYPASADHALDASNLFQAQRNEAGAQRANAERADALQDTANYAGCYGVAHSLLSGDSKFVWIQAEAEALDAYCDPSPGSDAENNPAFLRAETSARDRHYTLLELRVRNMRGGAAVDAGDAESAWRDYLATIREFYAGDYPALRLSGTLSGLEQVEQATPRSRLALLLQREAVGTLELTENRQLLPTARLNLAATAIRAGSIDEAREAMNQAQSELAANGGGKSVQSILAEVETALANVYLERREPDEAGKLLDSAYAHMAGERNAVYLRNYAVARGQLALEQGHPEAAEPLLRNALLEQERLGSSGGPDSIVHAQQNRDLYAVLAAIWLAEGRSGEQVLALWERYRLRILGVPVAACADAGLDCLQTQLNGALNQPQFGLLLGQVVLPDRLLLYRASSSGVQWTQVPVRRDDLLAAADQLERSVNSPESTMDTVSHAARRMGQLLIDPVGPTDGITPIDPGLNATQGKTEAEVTWPHARLLLEPDPLLGNLPWPSVATSGGQLGLVANLEESPSVLLQPAHPLGVVNAGRALVVGASMASGERQILPEVLEEVRAVSRFDNDPSLLVGDQATEPQVVAHLATASAIHFAGHAERQNGGTHLLLAPMKAATGIDAPWLDSEMLRKHPPRAARLAVFSACASGKKEAGWNHGMGDIVATLESLGVPDVVATRWQIDSGSAVPMMEVFYSGLAKGFTVPQALTAARQSMVRDPRYRHPYYWAAWYASGSGTADLSSIFHAGH
jgi:hypothetical protein